jgi:ribonuclease P protein component, eubacterial
MKPLACTLCKQERIKSKKTIETLFHHGQAFFSYPYKVYYIAEFSRSIDSVSLVQVAFSVPKKSFKQAYDRNRIKRLMRESYRLQKNLLKNVCEQHQIELKFIMVYIADDILKYETIFPKTKLVIEKLLNRITTQHSLS